MRTESEFPYLVGGTRRSLFPFASAAALLLTILSVLGLVFPDMVYSSPAEVEQFLTNDLVNLVVGLPFFLASLFYLSRGKMIGLLLLPGAYIYAIYNYFAALLGKPFDWFGGGNLLLVLLSASGLIQLVRVVDHHKVKSLMAGKVAEKFSGWVLALFGLAFLGLALSEIAPGLLDGSIPPLGEKAVAAADILVSTGWVLGGILLLRKEASGYSLGLGLLLAASSLFLGLILFFLFAPFISGRAFDWVEVATVLVMGMIAFLPTGLFWSGVQKSFIG